MDPYNLLSFALRRFSFITPTRLLQFRESPTEPHRIQLSKLSSAKMKTILILGASYGGISVAHRILKQTKATPVKVILVSPNTHHYWNVASTRALVPGQIPDEKIFQAIAPGFKQYPSDLFEFINASADNLNVEAKKVTIASSAGQQSLSYDILILATGSNTKEDVPFKGCGTTEATKDALHIFQNKVKQAHSIYIAGAGATGVEVTGELAFEYGKQKKITLVRY